MKWLALLLGGCILPVSTGAPQPATTVGQGHIGVSLNGEAPVLDLIAKNTGSGSGSDGYASTYGESPAAAGSLTFAYGLGPDTDLEVAGEGAFYYYILPLPTGISAGIRQHLIASDAVDFAIAGRIGGVTTGTTQSNGSTSTRDDASALYGALQAIVQMHEGRVRPLLALNLMPFRITRALANEPIQKFKGFASSLTFALMLVSRRVQIGPYVTVTDFESQQFSGGRFVSGGLMFAFRTDRSYKPPPPQVMTPAPAPPPMPLSYPAAPPP